MVYITSGAEFAVNGQLAAKQYDQVITVLANGNILVSWATNEPNQDGSSVALKAKIFNPDGQALGSEFVVNTQWIGAQSRPAITALDDGRFLVSWETSDYNQDSSGFAIKAQIFSSNGTPSGDEFLVNNLKSGNQIKVTATTLTNGNIVIGWESALGVDFSTGSEIRARIFNSNGAAVSAEFQVNQNLTGNQDDPVIRALPNGGFVAVWDLTGSTSDVYAQVFTADGVASGPEILVNSVTTSLQYMPRVAVLTDGRFVVTWITAESSQSTIQNEIKAQIFDQSGAKIGGEFVVNTIAAGNQTEPAITALANGGFFISWTASTSADAYTSAIKGREFSSNGLPVGDENLVVNDTFKTETRSEVVGLEDGRIMAIWSSAVGACDFDIRAQFLTKNVAPELGEPSRSIEINENNSLITTIVAADPNAQKITYSIIGGDDASKFVVNSSTGQLYFSINSPNFEAPLDINKDNIYSVTIIASDGLENDTQNLSIIIKNIDEPIYFTSPSYRNYYESTSIGYSAFAKDPEGATLTYAITGGADAALFVIDTNTGYLSLVGGADYEQPTDADANNQYQVTVSVSDGFSSVSQDVTINIYDTNERPILTNYDGSTDVSLSVVEGAPLQAQILAVDPENLALSYSIAASPDASLFNINSQTGELYWKYSTDYENPQDGNQDNVYLVRVVASDGSLDQGRLFRITVNNQNEGQIFSSQSSYNIAENVEIVGIVTANDIDGDALTYFISGGPDASRFVVDAQTGVLSFGEAPNFEAPSDADGDNVYIVAVSATDGSFTATQNVSVTVSGVNEAPSFSFAGSHTITENTTYIATVAATDIEDDAVTYSILGGADAAGFVIDGQTGTLSFLTAPDYDVPGDTDGDNIYDVVIQASDGSLSVSQVLSIVVEDINEAPSIVGPTNGVLNVSEGSFAVFDFAGIDPEGVKLTYAIDRDQPDDNWAFIIDPDNGQLSFIHAPDYENLSALDGDAYHLTVQVSDGTTKVSQNVEVRVTNINEDLVITSNGAGSSAALSVAENGSAVTQVQAVDQDGTAAAYSIVGGADAARFTINAVTGQLAFVSAPNREAPTDADGNNVYDVVVQASDGEFVDQQALSVTVTNVNEGLAITSNGGGATAQLAVTENSSAVTQVQAVDQDGTASTYSIVGGADAARFTINAQTGQLAFVSAPNHEVPTDADGNNVYDVIVQASDGQFTDQQALSVSIINVNEGVTITGNSKANTISTTTTVSGQLKATALEDTIYGLGGNDSLYGGDGADYIDGGTGNDNLYGQGGADLLLGGSGADRFIFENISDSRGSNIDTIFDFNKAETDRISLSAIDANISLSGDQSFTFIGTNAFTGAARQLRYTQSDGDTWVSGDVNGDGVADFQIRLLGTHNLASTDFIL